MFAEPVFKVALSFSLFYPKKEKYRPRKPISFNPNFYISKKD